MSVKLPFRELHSFEDAQSNFEALEALITYAGNGVPTISADTGDWYRRKDTPAVANQRLYVCTGGNAWTGIL